MMFKTLTALEFDKITTMLANEAVTDYGRKTAGSLAPTDSLYDAENLLSELSDAIKLYTKKGNPPIMWINDISTPLKRVEAEGALNAKELLNIAKVLGVASGLISYYFDEQVEHLAVEHYFSTLFADKSTQKAINNAIISENEIADDASAKLFSIRRRIESTHLKIREHLNNIIHGSKHQKHLQEAIITMRDGRYVVPVKAEHSKDVGGIVHDMSATGATVFIEPNAVVQANNALRELELSENIEIERILSELSALVFEITTELAQNQKVIGQIDFLFAKVRFAAISNAVIPKLNDVGIVKILNGRHPLLNAKKIVPITVSLGKSYTALIITGPNTGGKTVSLKTVGLFCAMAAAGLAVPADEQTELCVFDRIFADIGDEQSIEQSLSTFSSHMINIVQILNCITPKSLVLLDELGAGTDPTEGAALAIAILKHISQVGACVVATTHYSEIKLYALSTKGVENASCEFDVNSLRPTYRLLTGIPGKSNAFAISKRLGLSDDIIKSASAHLTEESVRFEDVISSLEHNKQQAEQELKKANAHLAEIERLKAEVESEKAKLEQSRRKLTERAQQQARRIVESAKKESEELVGQIRAVQKEQNHKAQNAIINEVRSKLNEKIKASDIVFPKATNKGAAPKNLAPGDLVHLVDLEQNGTVLSHPKSDGSVTVQVGVLKINTNISNLKKAHLPQKQTVTLQRSSLPKTDNLKSELDLRGNTLDDALLITEKYLDDAYLSSVKTVAIIHGKGTGVLRKGIHDMLRRQPLVKSYRLGTFGEGESGVTIVELKQ
ncbi:MAG: endonuclease MutS2 [Firmicutes bacterium]|nr:endonuclease MutS2 [Bacillota bacterium]